MSFKKNITESKPERKSKNSVHRFIGRCFKGSPVKGEEDELHARRPDEKKKLKLPWFDFPWPMFKKKKKKKKTVPFDLQSVSSSFSFFSSSSNGVSTPKARNSKSWCKRKQKTPSEPPSGENSTESTTTTIHSTNQTISQPGPINNSTQSANRTNRTGSIRRAIQRTVSNHNMARNTKLKLGAGLWVMVTSLGVMLVLGRASAVVFLTSCWYIVPMVMEGD